jgi:hypothetical protein
MRRCNTRSRGTRRLPSNSCFARSRAIPDLTPRETMARRPSRTYLDLILANAQLPLTVSLLAGISRVWGDDHTSVLLLRRYLELAPDAPNRADVVRTCGRKRFVF